MLLNASVRRGARRPSVRMYVSVVTWWMAGAAGELASCTLQLSEPTWLGRCEGQDIRVRSNPTGDSW